MEIKFNTEMKRYEVYPDKPVIRAGKPQPSYVSASLHDCGEYVDRVRKAQSEEAQP